MLRRVCPNWDLNPGPPVCNADAPPGRLVFRSQLGLTWQKGSPEYKSRLEHFSTL